MGWGVGGRRRGVGVAVGIGLITTGGVDVEVATPSFTMIGKYSQAAGVGVGIGDSITGGVDVGVGVIFSCKG